MTDPAIVVPMADVAITIAPAGAVGLLALWAGEAPDLAGVPALSFEPRRWWLFGAGAARIAAAVAGRGSVTAIGGGLSCATLRGSGWRAALMIGGLFDAESPGFRPGDCAATVLHDIPVWLHAESEAGARVWFPASYAGAMAAAWGLARG